jgi:thiamine-phosphate pyrophosphorylase
MRLAILSPPEDVPDEHRLVGRILRQSSAIFHLRKPGRGQAAVAAYLRRLPPDLHPRIMVDDQVQLLGRFPLRGVHLTETERRRHPQAVHRLRHRYPRARFSSSFHRLSDLSEAADRFDYVFLSPIFDSISKAGYRAAFDHMALARFLTTTRQRVFALGGIDARQVATAAMLGFAGVAVLGAVWHAAQPQQAAGQLSVACRKFGPSEGEGRPAAQTDR